MPVRADSRARHEDRNRTGPARIYTCFVALTVGKAVRLLRFYAIQLQEVQARCLFHVAFFIVFAPIVISRL